MSDNGYYVNHGRRGDGYPLKGPFLSEIEYVGTYSNIVAPVVARVPFGLEYRRF